MENRLPSSFKVCATCALWAGNRTTDGCNTLSVFEQNQTGKCCGGGFNQAQMNPIASCGKWQKWQAFFNMELAKVVLEERSKEARRKAKINEKINVLQEEIKDLQEEKSRLESQ